MYEGKIVIIFSGYNNRAVIAFIRTLEKHKITYVIIAKSGEDPIFKTAYKANVLITRESQKLCLTSFKKYIELIQNKYKGTQYVIAPSTEALNRFLQKERMALKKINVTVPLPDPEVYVSVSDKKAFGEICRDYGILTPDEYSSLVNACFPFVAKPRQYFSRDGNVYTPFLIFNESQKKAFLEKCNPDDFYFQGYVAGESKYLLYYFHRNGKIFKYSQENLIQQPGGKSIVAAIPSDIHNTNESAKYERLFRFLGFFGLVMVELKVGKNKNYMIEANPRFWGPSQLFVDAGLNFFEALLHDYNFIPNLPVFNEFRQAKYFWFGGIQKVLRSNEELFFHKGCERELMASLDKWIHHDIYKRNDTIAVFKEEVIWNL